MRTFQIHSELQIHLTKWKSIVQSNLLVHTKYRIQILGTKMINAY